VQCTPLEVKVTAPTERGFLTSLPGAFIYPFRGAGVLILIFSAILFSVLGARMVGIFGIIIKLAALGYLFSYMQNIIHATASEENELPELPGMDDLFGGCWRLLGTIFMSFGLPIGLLVVKVFGVDVPVSVIMITGILGCLYFPMAFLAVAIKDDVMASNPLVMVPSILRVPMPYLAAFIVFLAIFAVQRIGDIIAGGASSLTFTTTEMSVFFASLGIRMIWSFLSIYLLTVNIRIMGLLYATQKDKLGW
jgi:hypothetical protein